ncbi:hypothetical protein F7725_017456 [Dissostichus mawsoni]|uniref:Uncharacterized protein n=1 Tax=Dissostichus mawsoni TaxID=36200 RepID=A0A7J5Z5C5_DISMA|nr:hypothetical protein F7725_017456 [Dissostichus mawsoni]
MKALEPLYSGFAMETSAGFILPPAAPSSSSRNNQVQPTHTAATMTPRWPTQCHSSAGGAVSGDSMMWMIPFTAGMSHPTSSRLFTSLKL